MTDNSNVVSEALSSKKVSSVDLSADRTPQISISKMHTFAEEVENVGAASAMEEDITSMVKKRVVSIKEESKDSQIIASEPNQTKDDDKLITGGEVAMQPNVPIKSTIKRTKHKIGNVRNEPGLQTQKAGRLTEMEIPDNEIVNRSNNTRRVQQS